MFRLLVALAIYAFVLPAYAVQATKTQPPPSFDRGTEQKPVVVQQTGEITIKGEVAEKVSQEDQAKRERSEKDKSVEDHRLSVSTIVLAALTLILGVVAIGQLIMFYVQLKVTRDALKDAKDAADAAKLSADATRIAADAAKESADSQQKTERAYVFVEVIKDTFRPGIGNMWTLVTTLKCFNHGKTPAILKVFRGYGIPGGDTPQQLVNHPNAEREMPEGLVIRAGDHKEFPIETSLTDAEYQSLRDDNGFVHIVGKIGYEDVMGKDHVTGYCWRSKWKVTQTIFEIVPSPLNHRN
jgi:hypothetical protein